MTIGINASQLAVKEKSGIEYVVENFVREFISHTASTGDTLILYVRQGFVERFPSHVKVRVLAWPFGKLWTQVRLGLELIVNPPDVFLDFSNFFPLICFLSPSKKYFFAHDYGFLEYPKKYPLFQLLIMHVGNFFSGTHATHIFTPTEHTRNQIASHFPQWKEKTTSVGLGLKKSFLEALRSPSSPQSVSLQKKFFLFVGRIDQKKNLANLIRGFHEWNQNQKEEYQLVLCGRQDSYYRELQDLCTHHNIHDIEFSGFVSEQELANLYVHCQGVVLPSYGEGFGLPIIEGLAAGRPVMVATTTGGISSVLKEHLVFCEPDAAGIAKGFDHLVASKECVALQWETFEEVVGKMYGIIKSKNKSTRF